MSLFVKINLGLGKKYTKALALLPLEPSDLSAWAVRAMFSVCFLFFLGRSAPFSLASSWLAQRVARIREAWRTKTQALVEQTHRPLAVAQVREATTRQQVARVLREDPSLAAVEPNRAVARMSGECLGAAVT